MRARVAKWGNSLGVRIPREIADKAGMAEGSDIEIEARAGRVVISSARRRYRLDDLLKGMTPEAMREAFDWGPDRGREIVEE
jgi:antitoxin MazE